MNIKNNSKFVKKNDIFICTHDDSEDRHKYIKDLKNASLIITDKDIHSSIPTIKVDNTNDSFFQIYNDFYNHPLKDLNIFGVTGTDGKTTVAYLLNQILNNIKKSAYLGTIGFIYNDIKEETPNTTVSIDKFLEYAATLKKETISNLVMEISSEGLLHNRCSYLKLKRAIITNITGDHLNIHKSFENYLHTKLKIFDILDKDGIAIVNIDDISYKYIKNKKMKILSYGFNKKANYRILDYKLTKDKTYFTLEHKNNKYNIESPLLGKFNIYNLVAVIACLNSLNIDLDYIVCTIKKINQVPGRLNTFYTKNASTIILDYAHTVNATREILKFANIIKRGKIITVVGCAGGRDKNKRKDIGKIVTDFSDTVIFTMDDPRYENVKDIVNDMTEGINTDNYIYIKSRKKAIKRAVSLSKKNDIILILGKGTDNYMAIKHKHKKYSDLKIIKKYIK